MVASDWVLGTPNSTPDCQIYLIDFQLYADVIRFKFRCEILTHWSRLMCWPLYIKANEETWCVGFSLYKSDINLCPTLCGGGIFDDLPPIKKGREEQGAILIPLWLDRCGVQ